MHQVFVNLSLIISTELENKLPANDAEPEIMPGFKSKLSKPGLSMTPMTKSHTAKCFHVKLPGTCQFSWRIEWVCHGENVIIWLTVNVILFHLCSCPSRQITHCFIHTEWHSKSLLCSTSSLCVCLQCCVCLNGVTSSRVQGNEVQHFFCLFL